MTRLLLGIGLVATLLVVPAALAQGQHDECDNDDPYFAPEGGIFLTDKRGPDYEYTVTLEGGTATATVGNDNCSPSEGTVTVAGVTIEAPTEQGGRNTADLGVLPAGTQTFDVTVDGEMSVWLLIESTGFDDVIDCFEVTDPVGDADTTPLAFFERGDNNAKNEDPCEEIGFNLLSSIVGSDQVVTFEFEVDDSPSWFGTIEWAPEPLAMPVPQTRVDLDQDGAVDLELEWCLGFDGDGLPILPAGDPWCLLSQTAELLSATEMQVTQEIYGLEDPDFLRPK